MDPEGSLHEDVPPVSCSERQSWGLARCSGIHRDRQKWGGTEGGRVDRETPRSV